MTALVKALVATSAIGGGIAIPVYFLNKGGGGVALNTQVQTQNPVKTSQGTLNRSPRSSESESIEQVSCNVSDFSSEIPYISSFVTDKQIKTELYSLVSCDNTTLKGEEDSYLGKKWEGLFPKDVLSGKLSYTEGKKFTVTATTDTEGSNSGDITITTFSNMDTKSSIRGEWTEIKPIGFKKNAITVAIENMRETPNKIYLFVDEKS